MISGDSMESRIVKVQHEECNEVISNQGVMYCVLSGFGFMVVYSLSTLVSVESRRLSAFCTRVPQLRLCVCLLSV